jgi:uncharacterized protein (DUF4415 family)
MKTSKKATALKTGQQNSARRSRSAAAAAKGKSQAGARRGGGYGSFKGTGWQAMGIGDLYRPLKKPVTLRLDADVLAWFKGGGSRYQTRINAALRWVMEGELKKR